MSNDLVAIAPVDHPLSSKDKVTLEEFCQEEFLVREAGSGTRYAIEAFFRHHGLKPKCA